MFEGVTGTSFTGDIAIDDVEVLDGACPKPGWCTRILDFVVVVVVLCALYVFAVVVVVVIVVFVAALESRIVLFHQVTATSSKERARGRTRPLPAWTSSTGPERAEELTARILGRVWTTRPTAQQVGNECDSPPTSRPCSSDRSTGGLGPIPIGVCN